MLAFHLKKLLGMLLMPIPLVLVALCVGLLLMRHRPRAGKGVIAGATLFLLLTSWNPVADSLLAPFEDDFPIFDVRQRVAVVVVLGGCHATDDSLPPAAQLCATSLHRLTEGVRILAANPEARLFVSGFAGVDRRPHADVLREVAIALGVEATRIEAFPEPRDTAEEAAAMAPALRDVPFALVSEASHLPRAVDAFEAAGLHPLPAPAVRVSRDESTLRVDASAAQKSERALYEGVGRLWRWLRD
jgi:uncharacterized SAM-binding protein YcdF (DUF218 family)